MANRDQRAHIAAETVAIVQDGSYVAPSENAVSVRDAVQRAIHESELITPGQWESLRSRAQAAMSRRRLTTTFEVRNETTFAASRRLVERFGAKQVAALNFASAKNPGGGFLGGSQAQEESLARASFTHVCRAKGNITKRIVASARSCIPITRSSPRGCRCFGTMTIDCWSSLGK